MAKFKLIPAASIPAHFDIAGIDGLERRAPAPSPAASEAIEAAVALPRLPITTLGPLAAFKGDFRGKGFNTIFRPQNPTTPTPLPIPQPSSDNILELNLTEEVLSFSPALGQVPNRGLLQGDIFLNGVPYLQTINDVTDPAKPVGIHLEPGLWIVVPSTTSPPVGPTVARMASIPHGTTINAQGTFRTFAGPPTIPAVDITPTFLGSGVPQPFPSQIATNSGTPRIPQDLTPFMSSGRITAAMLKDPNTVLRDAIAGQHIVSTTEISVDTQSTLPLVGGGTDNIAFLQGRTGPNALSFRMTSTFWIERVEHTFRLPVTLPATRRFSFELPSPAGDLSFQTIIPRRVLPGHVFKFHTTQIQYTQTVFLDFAPLRWPHVSVATLAPAGVIRLGSTVWR